MAGNIFEGVGRWWTRLRVEDGLPVGNVARDALAIDSLFHESSEVRKDVSIDGRMGVWSVKGTLQGHGNEERTSLALGSNAEERGSPS